MENILNKVKEKRSLLKRYIFRQKPINRWLVNITIICGIFAATMTGIPAVGGEGAIKAIKSETDFSIPVWQVLCIGATLCSIAATSATAVKNGFDTSNNLAKAQTCDARLEILELLLETDQIEQKEAIQKYGDYTAEITFL